MNECVVCHNDPCQDVIPGIEVEPEKISMMISEIPPEEVKDDFYAGKDALYAWTTLLPFQDARLTVASVDELLEMGICQITAVVCRNNGYGLKSATIKTCSTV